MLSSNNKEIKKYCRIHDKNISPFMNDIFFDRKILKTTYKLDCDLFMPKDQYEMDMLQFPQNTIINTIDNINEINRKNKLWNNLVDTWGRNIASKIIPPTFNILQRQDRRKFVSDYLYNKSNYILKNEQESARGILVSNDFKNIVKHLTDKKSLGFPVTVIQKIVKSHLINGHVFKMRMYLLIKCNSKTGKKHFYIHNLGGIFYAPNKYDEDNLENDNIIANGYWYNGIAKTDYLSFINDKPKNLQDLFEYFEKKNINSNRILNKINKLLVMIFKSIQDKIFLKKNQNDQICILGFDVMIDTNLKPWIIEFNKGPSTKYYDDAEVLFSKQKVWGDMYNLIENKPNNFQEIYSY